MSSRRAKLSWSLYLPLAASALIFIHWQLAFSQTQGDKSNPNHELVGLIASVSPNHEEEGVLSSSTASSDLPDAPEPQNQSSSQAAKISASGKPTAILAPQMTRHALTPRDKFTLYIHQATNPIALVLPALGAGLSMINPPSHYPHDWKAGGDAYGRLYGDRIARRESEKAAQFLTEVALHEDPRYLPSVSTNFLKRTYHAVSFAVVDKSDSGHNMPAFSNFAGAAADGFVGMGYLPAGYDDATHAGQRAAGVFAGYAVGNVVNEFCPEWSPLVMELHVPFLHPPCPERIQAKEKTAP
jgi:hypothetical protein